MNNQVNKPEGAGDYIWLSYTTQFTAGGRTHTVEMSIPVPVGANAEQREQLLYEAEEGLSQLVGHVAQRLPQILQRSLTVTAQGQASSTTKPLPAPSARPTSRPAAVPAPPTTTQPAPQVREASPDLRGERDEEKLARQDAGANTPSSAVSSDENRAPLNLPDFIQYIRENFNLNPTQAMHLLKVKSLRGVNLREAVDRLHYLVSQENAAQNNNNNETANTSARHSDDHSEPRHEQKAPGLNPAALRPASELPSPLRATSPTAADALEEEDEEENGSDDEYYVTPTSFDEEVTPDEAFEDELEDLDEPPGLTVREREHARALISKLRESRGATTASASRLQVLRNVTSSQIGDDQLQDLVAGVWGVTSLKKLKVDQLEALISWAKEDDFVREVEAVLAVLEEER
ncbi:MAG: hypothetical protein IMW89_03270 [Ktedonobacteraceae bacterium]|nr:hypothetical protein [Ktedonobacteraceae bacterium]